MKRRKAHVLVFSFNRAMQCDGVLRSILRHLVAHEITVSVIWTASFDHFASYRRLLSDYEPAGVRFFLQSGRPVGLPKMLPRLWMPRNLYHWLTHDYIRKADDFKGLVEHVVASVPADIVAFNTDDSIYYRDESIPDNVIEYLLRNPYAASYRTYVGRNLEGCPVTVRNSDGLLSWDYYDPIMRSHWAYPFSVDGTFYERRALLDVISRILYHNPITLESYLASYVRSKRLFARGMSPDTSAMVAPLLNKVSYIVPDNLHGDLSVATLCKWFDEGFRLEYALPEEISSMGFVPEYVFVVRGSERIKIPVRVAFK